MVEQGLFARAWLDIHGYPCRGSIPLLAVYKMEKELIKFLEFVKETYNDVFKNRNVKFSKGKIIEIYGVKILEDETLDKT